MSFSSSNGWPERSPAALDAAIGLLDRPSGDQSCGDILATGSPLQK
jgi:hypothetical protein